MDGRQVERIERVMGASHVFTSFVTELVEAALEEASDRLVSMSQLKLLLLISRPGRKLKVMDVARFLGVTNAAASRSIDRLVQQGLVNRTPTPEDRRAVDLTLTPQARDLLTRFTELRNQELMRRLGHHGPEDLERATRLLDRLSESMVDRETGAVERCLRCGTNSRGDCFLRDVMGHECLVGSPAGNGTSRS